MKEITVATVGRCAPRGVAMDHRSGHRRQRVTLHRVCARILRQRPCTCRRGVLTESRRSFLGGGVNIGHFLQVLNRSSICLGRFCCGSSGLGFVRLYFGRFVKHTPGSGRRVRRCYSVLVHRKIGRLVATVLRSSRCSRRFNYFAIPRT